MQAGRPVSSGPLLTRLVLAACLFAAECCLLAAIHHPWFHPQQILAGPIVFCAAVLFFGRQRLLRLSLSPGPVAKAPAYLHAASLAAYIALAVCLLYGAPASPLHRIALALWFLSLLVLPATFLASILPGRSTLLIVRALGPVWPTAIACAALAMSARTLGRFLWEAPDSAFGHFLVLHAFNGVRFLLGLFCPTVIALPDQALIGTPRFQIVVAGACSGMEGLALMLALSGTWLFFARRELRLARAVWLIPLSLSLIWVLNLIRITALILLGDHGHAGVAITGFHSEAGWIAFCAVGIAFLTAANQVSWLRQRTPASTASSHNPAAIYLLPFLAIVAASLLTRAASSGFEALYPIRLFVCLLVLWFFRRDYRAVNWKFSWLGLALGAAVGVLWIVLGHNAGSDRTLAVNLADLAPLPRLLWICCRVLAAVVTVPIAEELAFRGFIARRLVSEAVEDVPYSQLTWFSILASSLGFAVLHGRMWPAGLCAGVVFALCARIRNRLGEAVAAHATANLLLAAWVLTTGNYSLW